MEPSKTELAAKILTDARAELKEIFGDEHEYLAISIFSNLDRMIGRLHFVDGTVASIPTADQFPPITEFMGEKLELPKQVVVEELVPEKSAKEIFLEKVEILEAQIALIPNENLLDSYKSPADLQVVRGVAKRAGLEDFKKAEITSEYLDQIRAGLVKAAEEKAIKDKTNENLPK